MDTVAVELTEEELTYLLGRTRHQLQMDRKWSHEQNTWSEPF
jgi:hypothetical protein